MTRRRPEIPARTPSPHLTFLASGVLWTWPETRPERPPRTAPSLGVVAELCSTAASRGPVDRDVAGKSTLPPYSRYMRAPRRVQSYPMHALAPYIHARAQHNAPPTLSIGIARAPARPCCRSSLRMHRTFLYHSCTNVSRRDARPFLLRPSAWVALFAHRLAPTLSPAHTPVRRPTAPRPRPHHTAPLARSLPPAFYAKLKATATIKRNALPATASAAALPSSLGVRSPRT